MSVVDFTFYLFAIVVVIAGLLTVVSKNPVHSVLWLILAFLSSSGLFVLLGAEFVAMLLIIVYVGAVAVLIYDKYILMFQLAGLILLVAMIGAIMLTLRHRTDIKRQDVLAQMYRDPAKAMELKDVKPGQGL
jgi:NADH:ubiquinone oxidoreductase subunit 6 (subunit J)